jgi:iron complex transport system permease protein
MTALRLGPPLTVGLALAFGAAVLVGLSVGSVRISAWEIVSIILRRIGVGVGAPSAEHEAVFFAIRAPRVLLGVLVGAALGISGAAMQGIFRNPLVDPGLLGISSGAALGAVLAIVLGATLAHGLPHVLAPYLVQIAAFAGAIGAMALVQRFAGGAGRGAITTLLLAGIAVNALAGAFTGLLTFSANDAQLRSITFWSFGSLGGATWRTSLATAPFVVLPLLVLPRLSRALDALMLGDREAGHLGFSVEGTKRAVIALTALAVGASVAISGVLGFVGLVVPHLARLALGPAHRKLLPASAVLGAILLVLADVVARTIATPAELPLGLLTAVLGTPFFLVLLVRERRRLA